MNKNRLFDALEDVEDEFILDAEEYRPVKAKRLNLMRRVAIGIAAMFVLCVAVVGTAAAVDEDIQMFLLSYTNVDDEWMKEYYDFDNEARAFLWRELGLDKSSMVWMDTQHVKDGIYVAMLRNYNMQLPAGPGDKLELVSEEIYVLQHTWRGFEITGHAVMAEAADQMLSLERLYTKNVTVFFGRGHESFGDIDGDGERELTLSRLYLSDGDHAGCLGFGYDNEGEYPLTFLLLALGDHGDAEVTDIALWEGGNVENVISYTSLYGSLPEIVNK